MLFYKINIFSEIQTLNDERTAQPSPACGNEIPRDGEKTDPKTRRTEHPAPTGQGRETDPIPETRRDVRRNGLTHNTLTRSGKRTVAAGTTASSSYPLRKERG